MRSLRFFWISCCVYVLQLNLLECVPISGVENGTEILSSADPGNKTETLPVETQLVGEEKEPLLLTSALLLNALSPPPGGVTSFSFATGVLPPQKKPKPKPGSGANGANSTPPPTPPPAPPTSAPANTTTTLAPVNTTSPAPSTPAPATTAAPAPGSTPAPSPAPTAAPTPAPAPSAPPARPAPPAPAAPATAPAPSPAGGSVIPFSFNLQDFVNGIPVFGPILSGIGGTG